MKMRILSVAYPLAPVRMDATGGAEQILAQLDRALADAGHAPTVLACEGSQCAGTLVSLPPPATEYHGRNHDASAECRGLLKRILTDREFDLVHMHGLDFQNYLPDFGPPVLVTLHLPASFYSPAALFPCRQDVWFNTVSALQEASFLKGMRMLGPIENGVPIMERFPAHKQDFALMLTRICPEKGVHLAIEAAKRADMRLIICGEVFPYPEHLRYFAEEVVPRLDDRRRYAGSAGGLAKQCLLTSARCLLVPSLVAETSSLAAREAMAAGTPVIAYRSGALTEIVKPAETGFLVSNVEEMAEAMQRCVDLSPAKCVRHARESFPLQRMIDAYFAAYQAIISGTASRQVA